MLLNRLIRVIGSIYHDLISSFMRVCVTGFFFNFVFPVVVNLNQAVY